MEQFKFDFQFNEVISFSKLNFDRPLLWIINVNKIPPHIGISTKEKYFSLKHNGKDEMKNTSFFFEKLKKSKISVVFVELNNDMDLTKIKTNYDSFTRASNIKNSCLQPILKILNLVNQCEKISDLLKKLEANNQIKQYFGLHLPKDFKGIPFYTTEEIEHSLNRLLHVER